MRSDDLNSPFRMYGLWLEDSQLSLRKDIPVHEPPPGEALVRVRLAGICATDLEMVRGYYPYRGILGHEFVGEVVSAPSLPELRGQRVVGEINAACGECSTCRRGHPTHCERRTVLGIVSRHGAFAETLLLPVKNLHPVPASVPDRAAVFTEPLAAALEIQEQVHVLPTQTVLVIGAGRLGQLVAQTLALTGCDLRVVARHPRQYSLLASRAIETISAEEIPERCYDLVVEATGSAAGFDFARRAVRPRGVIVVKSTYHGELQLNFSPLVVDEITLIGSRCGPFAPALRLLEQNRVDPSILVEACYPLDQAVAAMEHAARPGALKILLEPQIDK